MKDTPPPHYAYYPPEDDELSLIDLWNIVWKRKWYWLTLGPIFAVIGAIYALSQPDIFRAEATLVPNSEEEGGGGLAALAGQFGGLASMAGLNIGNGGSTNTALATLRSRLFLTPFINIDENARALFPNEWNPQTKTWTVASERRGADNRPTKQEVFERFTKHCLKISEDKKTGIVTLAIELSDANRAADWANTLATNLNSHLRELAKLEAEKNLSYLEKQLAETKVIGIRESLYTLIESQTKNAMLANAKAEYAFKIVDPAVVPEKPIRPKKKQIVIVFGIIGGVFGIALCFFFHLKNQVRPRNVPTAKNA